MRKNTHNYLDDLIFVAFITLLLMTTVRIVSKNIDLSYEKIEFLTSKLSESYQKTLFSGF